MTNEAGGLTNTPMLEQVFVNPDHSSQVLYQLSELWRDKKLCDATIEVGPVKVYVHRLVLLAACPYLLTVGGQHEVSILEVKLPMTVGLEGLNIFLTYLYDGVLHLTSANLRSVEKLTKILKVTSIQKFCQEFRETNKETGTADKITTDYSLKMTNSSLQIIFSEIQSEMKRECAESETETTPSKRPRMNLDKLSAALQKKSEAGKDNCRGHSVTNVASSGPSEDQHDNRDIGATDPLMMQVKEEPMSDYDDEDDTSYSEDTSESQSYSGTTDFVRQAPYDTRPFPDDEESVGRGNKMVVALPPPPSLQKRPSVKRKSFHSSGQHTSQTSETDPDGVSEDMNSGDLGAAGEGGVDATKVLKNIVKSMPEMAMNLGTSSEIGEDNKPRNENKHIGQKSVSYDNLRAGVFQCKVPGCHYQSSRLFNLNRHVTLRHILAKKRSQRQSKKEKPPKRIEKVKVKTPRSPRSGEAKERYLGCQYPGCRFRTARSFNLTRHVTFKHATPTKGEETNICEKCGETFVLKQGLEHHRETVHAGILRYMCKLCNDGFQNLADFQTHMSQHIKTETYLCDHCESTFQTNDDLTTHMLTCEYAIKAKKGMYRCQWCMERFSRKEVLTDHIKVHSSSKTYPCEVEGCGRVFTYKSALNKHVLNKHWALGLARGRESGQHMYVTVSEGDLDKGLASYAEQPVFMTMTEGEVDEGSANTEPMYMTMSEKGLNVVRLSHSDENDLQ